MQMKKLVRVKTKQKMIISDTPMAPMEKVSLDIVGPFPVSKKGNNNILTIQCNFSKFCMAIPIQNATAEAVADAFIKRFICIFGAPLTILTDQGANFMSNLMKRVAKKFKISQVKTTAYHPQSNGSLERSHHSLSEYMKMYLDKDNDWDEYIELATLSYNTAQYEGHRFTPFELIFGKIARLPLYEITH
jgi:transposase InsO family protein